MHDIMFIGLGVHKATVSVAVASGERGDEVRAWGRIPNRPSHIVKLVEKLKSKARQLYFCYEAGPCGYGLHRQIIELGHGCDMIAPSGVPVKAGDRVKTDRHVLSKFRDRGTTRPALGAWRRTGVPEEQHQGLAPESGKAPLDGRPGRQNILIWPKFSRLP
nr:hypothetical protein [uncultured Roseovarius sp.]